MRHDTISRIYTPFENRRDAARHYWRRTETLRNENVFAIVESHAISRLLDSGSRIRIFNIDDCCIRTVAYRKCAREEYGLSRRSDRKSTRLNSSHQIISYAVFCLKKKKIKNITSPTI